MSLPSFSTQGALFSLAGLGRRLFGPADRYGLFARKVYPLLVAARPKLASLYCADNGRPAVEPVLLAGVSLLQYLEGAPDRQAVDCLRYHVGWNLALNRHVGDDLFHPTCLVNFRQRLIAGGQSAVVFAQILEGLVAAGLVARQGKQRLDSTQVFGLVSRMSKLECVRESLRLALAEVKERAQKFALPAFWEQLWSRYVESKLDYKASRETLVGKLQEAGADAWRLLGWVERLSDKEIAQGEEVKLLRRVFGEQFEVAEGREPVVEPKREWGSGTVQNPHEPEATWAAKGRGAQKKEHVGYKVQVAETVNDALLAPGEPTRNFIVGVATQPAHHSDEAGAEQMAAEQAAMGLDRPPTQYVDAAYISAEALAVAAAQGRELIGPAQPAPQPKEGRFSAEAFAVEVEQRQARCPGGRLNTQCSRLEDKQTGKVVYRFEWSTQCADCPLRGQCVGEGQKHRTLVVGEHHTLLQARRQEQKTEAFQEQVQARNALEGTQSELVRGHGLRQARYRGLEKDRLQNYFIGAACNAKRWIRRLVWEFQHGSVAAAVAVATG
jgi:transposase